MKILFVHNHLATFTRIDLDILRSQHVVRELHVRHSTPVALAQSTYEAIRGVLWCDLVFAWFGAFHAFLPFVLAKLLGKPCVVVASGYDVANAPEINYGNMRPGPRRWVGRWVFKLADRVLAVSQFTAGEAIANAGVPPQKLQVIPHGIPTDNIDIDVEAVTRQPIVLTVGAIDQLNLKRKGLLDFAHIAAAFPNYLFFIIGPHQDLNAVQQLHEIAPVNLIMPGRMNYNDLRKFMYTASVYVQLSYYESFCMALAEAMAAGCIPVVTDKGALPEVAGDIGYVNTYGDIQAAVSAVKAAMSSAPEMRKAAQQRINTTYSLDLRRRMLLTAINTWQATI